MESNPEAYDVFMMALFENQPAENSDGLPTSQLVSIAASAGVSQAGQTCIAEERYRGFATKVTARATSEDGVGGTPTILVNGELVDRDSGETVYDALAEAGVAQ